MGFPGSSDSKESACNVGDPGLIPGLGRSPREGNGYPLQNHFIPEANTPLQISYKRRRKKEKYRAVCILVYYATIYVE